MSNTKSLMMHQHTVDIYEITHSRGGSGGKVRTATLSQSDVACHVRQLSKVESEKMRLETGLTVDWRAIFAEDPSLQGPAKHATKHALLFTDSRSEEHWIEVESVSDPHHLGYYWRVFGKETQKLSLA